MPHWKYIGMLCSSTYVTSECVVGVENVVTCDTSHHVWRSTHGDVPCHRRPGLTLSIAVIVRLEHAAIISAVLRIGWPNLLSRPLSIFFVWSFLEFSYQSILFCGWHVERSTRSAFHIEREVRANLQSSTPRMKEWYRTSCVFIFKPHFIITHLRFMISCLTPPLNCAVSQLIL